MRTRFAIEDITSILASLVVVVASLNVAYSKNLQVLDRIAYMAFVGEFGASMCLAGEVALSEQERSTFQTAKPYSQLIKAKIERGLDASEGEKVVFIAATRARDVLREVIRALKALPPDQEMNQLTVWCKGTMSQLIADVVGTYQNRPAEVDRIMEDAFND